LPGAALGEGIEERSFGGGQRFALRWLSFLPRGAVRCGAVRNPNPGCRLPTPVRWRVGPGTAASAGRKPVAALPFLPPKSWRGGPGGAAPLLGGVAKQLRCLRAKRAGPLLV